MRGIGLAATAIAAILTSAAACPALADPCRGAKARKRPDCAPPRKFEPYHPDRARAGRNPGFIDLGNGTEVRIGGRVRMDYDVRR